MDPLETAAPAFDAEDAARIAREVFGLSGGLTPLRSERDRNFRIDERDGTSFLLKIQNPADDEAVVDMQTAALLHLERVDPDLPVMRARPTTEGHLRQAVVAGDGRTSIVRLFTFLRGRNPTAEELHERALFEWGATAARLGRALRGFFHPAAGYRIQWDVRRAPRLRAWLDEVRDDARREAVTRVLDRFDRNVAPTIDALRAQVVHNDLSLDNVLVNDDGRVTGITDFGDMTHTALVCDLAVTVADVLDGRPGALDLAPAMVAGYGSITPLEPDEAGLLGDLVAARCATAIVIAARRLRLHPENQAYVATFDTGAWRFLRLLDAVGFDRVASDLRDAVERRALPYRPLPTGELLSRRRAVMGPAPLSYRRPLHLVRGEGVWLFDPEGHRYLDAYNNVPVAGHGHPRVVQAVAAQLRRVATNTRYLHEGAVELAERLLATMPGGFDRVLFVNSGSEANDVAWRIARDATGRPGAIVTRFAYHGITAATTDLSPEEWPSGTVARNVALVPAPDGFRGEHRHDEPGWTGRYAHHVAEAARELAARATPVAAMFLDAALTSDGVLCPPHGYAGAVARAVHEAGGLFVADEVQAGYGRLGEHLWSFAAAGADADLVTLGKPMGNGFPVAAVVGRSELVDPFAERTGFFSTFGGNPVACAAALAVLQVIDDEGLIARAADVGAHLRERLSELAKRHPAIGDVRGGGLMIGVELVRDPDARSPAPEEARAVADELRERGVLIGVTGPAGNVLKIRPPLVCSRRDADLIADELERALANLRPRLLPTRPPTR